MPGRRSGWRYGRIVGGHVRFNVPDASRHLCNGSGWPYFQAIGAALESHQFAGLCNTVEWSVGCLRSDVCHTGGIGGNDVNRDVVGVHAGVSMRAGVALSTA